MIKITERIPGKYGERFSVVIGEVTIKNCAFKEGISKAGKEYAFIAYPQRKVTSKDGVDSWIGDVVLSRGLQDQVLAAYKGNAPAATSMAADETPSCMSDDDIPF